ncbi:MAG: hypothetical protein K6U03_02665 [Firmicutes bacterium]|nr:hypothetical protein [Bacillota bacterium]
MKGEFAATPSVGEALVAHGIHVAGEVAVHGVIGGADHIEVEDGLKVYGQGLLHPHRTEREGKARHQDDGQDKRPVCLHTSPSSKMNGWESRT